MTVSLITAIGLDNEIGKGNDLLWYIPEDFAWFKQHTMHKTCLMGRKTHESIGKPLPKRVNVVLTKDENYNPHPNVLVRHSIDEVLHEFSNEKEFMILGGSNIYQQLLPFVNRIYLTKVHHEFPEADSHFPQLNMDDWVEYYRRDSKNDKYNYSFHVYKKH